MIHDDHDDEMDTKETCVDGFYYYFVTSRIHHDVREAREAREEDDSRVFFAIIVVFAIFAIGRGPDLTK